MAEIANTPLFNVANLEYYLKYEDNLTDSGFHGINATPTAITYVTGKFRKAASFDGSTSKIEVANDANLNFGTGSFTVCAWIYPTNIAAGAQDWIGRRADGSNAYFILRVTASGDYLIQFWYDGSNNYVKQHGLTVFANNNWYHVAAVIDRTAGQIYMYLNGVLINQGAGVGNPNMGTNYPWVMGEHVFSGIFPVGYMDDTALFSRALNASEISTIALSSANYLRQNRRSRFPGSVSGL
jgi:hypothetical protein